MKWAVVLLILAFVLGWVLSGTMAVAPTTPGVGLNQVTHGGGTTP